jgi:tRNA G18 (ribose-2'-O)-methylase SpoU
VISIANFDDPRVAEFANIRDRDLAGRASAFIVEGEVVVRMLLSPTSLYRPRALLLEERRVEKLADALQGIAGDVPVYAMPQAAMDRLVGFHIHRGVLALADRGAPNESNVLCAPPGPRLVIGLVGLVNHDNVGAVFRSAAAFGASGILLDSVTCDPLYRKAVRVSVGGSLLVPFARCASEHALVDELEHNGYQVIALSARGATEIRDLAFSPRRALLVGAEGPGLSPDILARATATRIAMAGTMDSLNASVACGIALYTLFSRG